MAWATTTKSAAAIIGAAKAAPDGRSWGDRLRALPSMIRATLSGQNPTASRLGVGMSLAGIVYVISPLDLIPDLLLPFGLVDDLGIAAVSVAYLVKSVDRYLDGPVVMAATNDGQVVQGVVLERVDSPVSEH